MKWIFLACVFLAACNNEAPAPVEPFDSDTVAQKAAAANREPAHTSSDSMITPGAAIGKVQLGAPASTLAPLGTPDLSDAAMGKAWLTWNGARDEHNNATVLSVYTTYSDSTMTEKTIQQVRTTSPAFVTASGIHVYASLAEIRHSFPSVQKIAVFNEDGRDISIYDAMEEGIAFEVAKAGAQQTCTGIIVHEKGKNVTDIYITLHPQMKKLQD